MPVRPNAKTILALNSQFINTYKEVTVNSNKIDVLGYSYTASKSFGAMSANLSIDNSEKYYGPGGNAEINVGDNVIIREGIIFDYESYQTYGLHTSGIHENSQVVIKFSGRVKQINPRVDRGISTLEIIALDLVAKLEYDDLNPCFAFGVSYLYEFPTEPG